ncbi:MAG: hypothetical protein IT386_18155 [Deltaproteobacteria bacterium]|nr:hypothetical protein [Deltaproteobacteria bacterium]
MISSGSDAPVGSSAASSSRPSSPKAGGKRAVLLVVHTNTYFVNLLPTARLLKRSRAYEPLFFFASVYPTLERDREICKRDEIRFVGPDSAEGNRAGLVHLVARRLAARGWRTPLEHVDALRATKARIRRLVADEGVVLMIFPSDNRYDIAAYIRAGHEAGVSSVVVPAFMAAKREWAEAMSGNPDYQAQRWPNRLAVALHPRWGHEHGGTTLVALPGEQLLAREWLGLAPPQPWTLHSGFADAIALESLAVRAYCVREGLPPEQLVVTGSADHDLMSEALADLPRRRAELLERLGLPPGRRLLVTALPPDQLYGVGRKECDFQVYADLVEFWMRSLARPSGFNVVVSLHPSVVREDWIQVERWGAKIADDKISMLIPLCDLFVASISATIQWAVACGKPVLNYDVYRYRYPDYAHLEAVIATEEQTEFVATLDRLTSDDRLLEEMAFIQRRDAPAWGVLDGRAGDRLLCLFDRLTGAA